MMLATPVSAQTTENPKPAQIEDACMTVAKNFLLTDNLNTGVVQSFPELNPPGVRMSYSTRSNTSKSDMSDTFECEFGQSQPPYNLTRFCVTSTCYAPDAKDAESKRRFEEMRDLLNRSQK